MKKNDRIFVAGHRGMVGSAVVRRLRDRGVEEIITRTRQELDLRDQSAVFAFLQTVQPDWIVVAAARVGGILANNTYRAQFIYDNLAIELNLIQGAHRTGVNNLLFLGSSCIYPRECPQPMKEEYLLTGPLEHTNEPYAVAKIAGIKLCENYFHQYGRNYFSVMPTNLYGPNDNYDLETSHVLPALIRKMLLARFLWEGDWEAVRRDLDLHPTGHFPKDRSERGLRAWAESHGIYPDKLVLWGSGTPYREFLHVDDLAAACVHLMENLEAKALYSRGISQLNVGTGKDLTIRELAELVQQVTGYAGNIEWDTTKPDGTPKKLLDVSRMRALGWEAKIGLQEGIEQEVRRYRESEHSQA
ncbi:MAG: GDP-L-fucose synthase [Candidatus Neomarinimicrobiota bacterium]|nr:MAG: GDP-L-fucose synthase [Candidatus Neomarinimicrobiota bacterium]